MDTNDKDQPIVAEQASAQPLETEAVQAGSPNAGESQEGDKPSAVGSDPAPKSEPKPAPEARSEASADPEPQPESGPGDPLERAKEETERFRNQMLRIAADFDNFRKRSRREVEDASRRAREDFLRELLPVFDNLERAATHAEQVSDARAVSDGVKMVLRQFQDTLAKLGVARLKTVGQPFDPNFHEAIQQIATDEHPAGTVVAEVLPGYAWQERLVRAAMVVVAKAPPPPEATPEVTPDAATEA
jgi:molecular chaperone GrpE